MHALMLCCAVWLHNSLTEPSEPCHHHGLSETLQGLGSQPIHVYTNVRELANGRQRHQAEMKHSTAVAQSVIWIHHVRVRSARRGHP